MNSSLDISLGYSELNEQRKVDAWNLNYRPGILVDVRLDSGETRVTCTSSEAYVMCGQAVIFLQGVRGCYSLDCVTPRA